MGFWRKWKEWKVEKSDFISDFIDYAKWKNDFKIENFGLKGA